jgi:hypothetical protein
MIGKFMLEIIDLIQIKIVGYLTLGILLTIFGPAGKAISDKLKIASNPLPYAINDQQTPSKYEILFLRIFLTLGMIFLWPIFIWDTMNKRRLQVAFEREYAKKSVGLWFDRMGGAGSIHCRDCQHSEKVTSFIHGDNSSHSGVQCQSCGKFTTLNDEDQCKESLICNCGGKLHREKVIFCPQCKSKNVRYALEFLT